MALERVQQNWHGFAVRTCEEARTWIKSAIRRPQGPCKRKADLI
ncbi:hypothetical protein KKY_1300 [Pelagibacterium halotolerans B2]|uniref:Uncharacterized protein n=1 Tax=Pelagibacterium halotolerans (strain DSM 22347 / JCM 15775 / CGMCC 1.7692 / B2) TaxID=1082931 RepID=G4R846_PELHB|nr:hypothetical protein KKY_1300 [Pelagibacterium halotolerans B2]